MLHINKSYEPTNTPQFEQGAYYKKEDKRLLLIEKSTSSNYRGDAWDAILFDNITTIVKLTEDNLAHNWEYLGTAKRMNLEFD